MKNALILSILILAAVSAQNTNTFLEASTRDGNSFYFVGFGPYLYTFDLPSLDLAKTIYQAGKTFSAPASFDGRYAVYSDGASGSFKEDTENNFALSYDASAAAPSDPDVVYPDSTITDSEGNTYTFNSAATGANVTKTGPSGNVIATASLSAPKPFVNYYTLRVFSLQGNTLYVVAAQGVTRGTYDFEYYAFSSSDLSVVDGPVTLPNSANSGCPVGARSCGVAVVEKLTVYNGVVVYTYSNSTYANNNAGPFVITVVSYSLECGFSTNSFDDVSKMPNALGSGNCRDSITTEEEPSTTEEEPSTTGQDQASTSSVSQNPTHPVTSSTVPEVSSTTSSTVYVDTNPPLAVTQTTQNGNNNGGESGNPATQNRSDDSSAASLIASLAVVAAVAIMM